MTRLLIEKTPDGERFLEMSAGYDRRSEGYGCHSANLIFGLRKGVYVITWRLMPPFYFENLRTEWEKQGKNDRWYYDGLGSIDIHSPIPLYEDQTFHKPCQYLQGECYSDGSSLISNETFEKAIHNPSIIWPELERLLEVWKPKEATSC